MLTSHGPPWVIVVLLLIGGQRASTCDNQATVLVGDSVEAHDRNLCASGTLVLQRSAYTWGTVVLNNAAVISGNYASITAGDITFVQRSVNLSRIDVKSRTLSFVSLELHNSRLIDANVNAMGPAITASNATFVGVNFTANATPASVIDALCDQCFITASKFTFGTEPSSVVIRRGEISNSTLTVSRRVCRAGQRVVFESCTFDSLNMSVVDSITGSCDRSSLEVAITKTNWKGGSMSVNSILEFPVSFSIVDSSFESVEMVVMMNAVLALGSQPRKLQVALVRSQLTSAPLNVMGTAVGPHLVDVSVRDSALRSSPLSVGFCNIREVAVSSWGNEYRGYQQQGAVKLSVWNNCSARLSLYSAGDSLMEAQFVVSSHKEYPSVPLDSVSITGMVALGSIGVSSVPDNVIDIYLLTLGEFSLSSSRFENGTVRSVVNAESSMVTIRNCSFASNNVSEGVLWLSNPKSLSIINCTFDGQLPILHSPTNAFAEPYSKGCVTVLYHDCWWRSVDRTSPWKFIVMDSTFVNVDGGLNITANFRGDLELLSTEFHTSNSGVDVMCADSFDVRAELLIFDRLKRAWTQKPSSLTGVCESNFNIIDSQFTGGSGDALVHIDGASQVNLTNVTIANNTMRVGLVNATGANVTAVSCRLHNNTASSPVLQALRIVLTNCTGTGNDNSDPNGGGGVAQATVIVDYGGVYGDNTAQSGGTFRAVGLQLWGTIGYDSKASQDGGFAVGQNATMSNVKLAGCEALSGGALFSSTLKISESSFEDCRATKHGGGAAYSNSMVVSKSNFSRCVASEGGALFSGYTLIISESSFQGCRTINTKGGAAYASFMVVSQSNFSRCHASIGGGALSSEKELNISGSSFEDCTAAFHAGAAFSDSHMVVSHSKFSRCNSEFGSGGTLSSERTLNISESSFEDCETQDSGGAAYSTSMVVSKSNFSRCKTSRGSGGALFSERTLNISESSFEDCRATKHGGGAAYSTSTIVSKSNFSRCKTSEGSGGALFSERSLNISESSFEDCETKDSGGAAYSNSTIVSKSSFSSCNAADKGGALFGLRTLAISESSFQDCKSNKDGGGAYSNNSMVVSQSNFSRCNADGSGGALFSLRALINISGSYFEDCAAQIEGGAALSVSMVVSQSNFSRCNAADNGGALFGQNTLQISESSFQDCQVDSLGGGGAAYSISIVVSQSNFYRCQAFFKGGALLGEKLQISESSFEDCRAQDTGGAASSPSLVVSKSNFSRCRALLGGALHSDQNDVTISESSFEDCGAFGGGAAYTVADMVVSQSNFSRCNAERGGALVGRTLQISESSFQDCRVEHQGGAAYSNSMVVSQSNFSRCIASDKGGALFTLSTLQISESSFQNCRVDNEGGAAYSNSTVVSKSSFSRCIALKGGGALVVNTSVNISGSFFEDCNARAGGAVQATAIVVSQSNFSSCRAGVVGGALEGNEVSIKSIIFYNCNSSFAGAVHAENIRSEQSIITGSRSLTAGGGYYAQHVFSSNDVFEDNEALVGGAVWCRTAEVNQAKFMRNRADGRGGGMHVELHANIRASIFVSNSATDGGGAIESSNGYLEMFDVLIRNNSARYAGGVGATYVTGRNVTLDNNTAVAQGGALVVESFHLGNTHFIGNRAAQGSAVYFSGTLEASRARNISRLEQSSTVLNHNAAMVQQIFDGESSTTVSISFTNTKVLRNLGTLLKGSMNVTFEDCLIENNDFSRVDFFQCKIGQSCGLSISRSTFHQNNGTVSRGSLSLIIRDSQFRSSTTAFDEPLFATFAGSSVSLSMASFLESKHKYLFLMMGTVFNASSVVMESNRINIELRESNGTVYNCTCRKSSTCFKIIKSQVVIRNLTASDNNLEGCGGDVSVEGSSSFQLQLLSSRFTRSRAYCGGSVHADSSNIVIEDCVFEGATAIGEGPAIRYYDPYVPKPSSPGGAIYFSGNGNSLRMARCIFTECSGGYGVLALVGVAEIELIDVTIANNTAVYGGAIAGSSEVMSRISIVRGAIMNNFATFGGAMFTTPTVIVSVSSDTEYLGNTAFYGDMVYLRSTTASITVSVSESGQAVAMRGGLFHVGVGIGVLISFVLLNERNERVMLGSNFTVKLADINPSASTRFDPGLESLTGTIYPNGSVLFPTVTVTGDPGTVIPLALKTELLPTEYNFTVKLDGCPELYGLAPYGSRGLACVLCDPGQYSYGGSSKCNACGANMVCERRSLPMSMKGYWITPVVNNIVVSVECPQEKLCVGGNQCDVGYNISSYVCGRCVEGKYHWNGKCVPCKMNYIVLIIAGILVFVFVNLYAVFIQQTALPSRTASLKILLQYSQVALLVVPRIPPSASATEVPVRFLSADMSWASLLPCFMRIEPSMFFHSSGILSGMLAIVFVLHRVVLVRWKQRKADSSQAITTYNSLISLLFMSVFSTTSSLFDFLSCVDVFNGQMVVTKAPSIVCSGERYHFHRALVALYCGVAWSALGLMLVKIIVDYNKAPSKTTALWTFMFYHFEDKYPERAAYLTDWQFRRARLRSHFCRWWQCIMLIRRVTILGVYVVVKRYKLDTTLAFPLVLVGFLYIHLVVNPYKSYFDCLTDGVGILLLLVASLISHKLILCYTIVMSGAFVLAGYMLFDLISRCLSNYRNRKGSQQWTANESGSSFSEMSETDGSWTRNYRYTESLSIRESNG